MGDDFSYLAILCRYESFGLWTLEELFRSNVIIHRARKEIQVDPTSG